IPGESRDSRLVPGLNARANLAVLSPCQEGMPRGQNGGGAPDSRTGLIIGDFMCGFVSRHEGRGAEKRTPSGGREKNAYCLIGKKKLQQVIDESGGLR